MAETQDKLLRDIEFEVELTRHLIGKQALSPRVMQAMARVPRRDFVPDDLQPLALRDGPLPIGHGQTISQPYIVALMSDLLEPQADHRILEIGTGSGYQAAVLATLVHEVQSLEIIAALARSAAERLARLGYGNVTVHQADGYDGWPEAAPYDGIIVTAAAPHIPPPLITQLKPGARLVIPIGQPGGTQQLKLVEKQASGDVVVRDILDVAFVPLTGPNRACG